MKEMGWSLRQYQEAPYNLVEEIWGFITTERKAQFDNIRKQE